MANINPLRYRGYYYDSETGMYYLQSRYYDPSLKRFINADVYCDTGTGLLGTNMFAYCENNAVNASDPEGYWGIIGGGKGHKKICELAGINVTNTKTGIYAWNKYADDKFPSTSIYSAPFHGRPEPEVFSIIKELYNLSVSLKNKKKQTFYYDNIGNGNIKLSKALMFVIRKKYKNNQKYINETDSKCKSFLESLNKLKSGNEQSEALLGLALHTVQDYFAHSIYVLASEKNDGALRGRMTEVNASLLKKYGIKTSEFEDNANIQSWRYQSAITITKNIYSHYKSNKKITSISSYREPKISISETHYFWYKCGKPYIKLFLISNYTSLIIKY